MRDSLTSEELAFFKAQGYLIVNNVLDKKLCAEVLDLLWRELPPHVSLKRDDPESHVGPFSKEDANEDSSHLRQGFRWRLRKVENHALLKRLVFARNLVRIVAQFLGDGMVYQPSRDITARDPTQTYTGIRGVYGVLPYGNFRSPRNGFHTDGHPFHLGMVAALEYIEPQGGGFRVWPGSHKRFYPTFALQYDQPRIPSYDHLPSVSGIYHPQALLDASKRVVEEIEPVDCYGPAGSVVFWHHRGGHGSGPNYTNRIRTAVLADYSRIDIDPCWVDPPHQDMWHDWSATLKGLSGTYSDAFAQSQHLG